MSKDKKDNTKTEEIEKEQTAQVETESEVDEKSEEQKLREELETQKDLMLRTAAEYDNYRKRTQKDLSERYDDAKAFVIGKLLPIVDNFSRALEQTQGSLDDYKKGIEMIYIQFGDTFKELGVTDFGEVGEPFDANLHNAVMHIEDENLDENVIAEVFQKGYKLGDRVIRHAMVKVAN